MSQVLRAFSYGPVGPCAGSWLLSQPAVPPRGACRQADPELFFLIAAVTSTAARQAEAAKAVCGLCAVRANCLSYALEARPEGIWGGITWDGRLKACGSSLRRASHDAGQRVAPGRTA